jgi:hypothetical protein
MYEEYTKKGHGHMENAHVKESVCQYYFYQTHGILEKVPIYFFHHINEKGQE